MLANVAWLDLRLRRRSTIGYAAGMAIYTLVVVALYPTFKNQTSLNGLSGSTAAALFGVTGKLTSSDGWLNANIYSNFLPLIMLLLTIGYGAASLAGQDENGTLALLVVLPMRRWAIVLQKLCAMAVQALVLAAATTVCVVIGQGFQLTVSAGNAVVIAVALTLMGLDFGLVAMAIGAATGRRGTALGIVQAWLLPRICSAPWPRQSPPSIRAATSRSSTGRSATTRSAREPALATSPSCSWSACARSSLQPSPSAEPTSTSASSTVTRR
jgi:ABC-2 type transport system permease protein